MMGTSRVAGEARKARSSDSPSHPGITMSWRMTAGWSCSASASASVGS